MNDLHLLDNINRLSTDQRKYTLRQISEDVSV